MYAAVIYPRTFEGNRSEIYYAMMYVPAVR